MASRTSIGSPVNGFSNPACGRATRDQVGDCRSVFRQLAVLRSNRKQGTLEQRGDRRAARRQPRSRAPRRRTAYARGRIRPLTTANAIRAAPADGPRVPEHQPIACRELLRSLQRRPRTHQNMILAEAPAARPNRIRRRATVATARRRPRDRRPRRCSSANVETRPPGNGGMRKNGSARRHVKPSTGRSSAVSDGSPSDGSASARFPWLVSVIDRRARIHIGPQPSASIPIVGQPSVKRGLRRFGLSVNECE